MGVRRNEFCLHGGKGRLTSTIEGDVSRGVQGLFLGYVLSKDLGRRTVRSLRSLTVRHVGMNSRR